MKWIIFVLLVGGAIFLFADNASAQETEIAFSFEIDGKPITQKFKVLFDVGGKIVEAKSSENGFYVPSEFRDCNDECDILAVRFTSRKYVLAFDGVYRKDLNADWVLGIDNKPFDPDKVTLTEQDKDVRVIHYLNFRPKDGTIATGLKVRYPKKKD